MKKEKTRPPAVCPASISAIIPAFRIPANKVTVICQSSHSSSTVLALSLSVRNLLLRLPFPSAVQVMMSPRPKLADTRVSGVDKPHPTG